MKGYSTFQNIFRSGGANDIVWGDVYPSSVTVAPGAAAPSFTAYNGGLRAYEFVGVGTVKEINMGFQFPHTQKVDGTIVIVPHIHLFIPNDITGGVIKFGLEYTWAAYQSTGAIATTTVYGTLTRSAGAGIANNEVLSFGNITATGKGMSSIFMCRLFRDPADVNDTFGSSVWIKSADIHAQNVALGSRTEFFP